MSEGTIRKALSGFYYVDDGQQVYACRARGKHRHAGESPLVGDRVEFTPLPDGSGALDRILPRKNQFARPAVANIDLLVVVASQAVPVTEPYLIDRVTALAARRGCPSLICVNKWDLEPGTDLASIYEKAGFPTVRLSAAGPSPARCAPLRGIPEWESPASSMPWSLTWTWPPAR